MLRLKTFYGLEEVFGIVSTYEQWRICWLPQSDERAKSSSLSTISESQQRLNSASDILSKEFNYEEEEYRELNEEEYKESDGELEKDT